MSFEGRFGQAAAAEALGPIDERKTSGSRDPSTDARVLRSLWNPASATISLLPTIAHSPID